MSCAIEQHVDWIVQCMSDLRARGVELVQAREDARDQWVGHVNALAAGTVLLQANSWYVGANVPGKPRVFMPYAGGVVPYRQKCNEVVAKGYEGFMLAQRTTADSGTCG
jgi:cyclohexanone monooxygenase